MSKRIAEALVECGYALKQKKLSDGNYYVYLDMSNSGNYIREHPVKPFADSLESRRQADALEDWLVFDNARANLWIKSFAALDDPACGTGQTHRQWRLDRIKWCFEQLEAQSE